MLRTRVFDFRIQDKLSICFGIYFTPAGTKMRSFRESDEIPAQTMTEAAFWHRGINLKFSETSLTLGERTTSFWVLEACSLVNSFSSETNILSKTLGVARDNSALLLLSRFCFTAAVSMCTFLLFSDLSPRSSWTTLLSVLSLISNFEPFSWLNPEDFGQLFSANLPSDFWSEW